MRQVFLELTPEELRLLELDPISFRISRPRLEDGRYRCPCCGNFTLPERGGYDICQVCFWEDAGQDDPDADLVVGGPNGPLSLAEARENYRGIGANCEKDLRHVRPARPDEVPQDTSQA
jgi:hypothetical protein